MNRILQWMKNWLILVIDYLLQRIKMSHELYSDLGNWENNCDIDLGGKREVVGTQINKEFRF